VDEAFEIAARGGMRLFEADCHLEYARLYVAQPLPNPPLLGAGIVPFPSREGGQGVRSDAAREHLAIAKKMIDEMGYHRRDREVQELEAMMRAT
jgi:hypothetical protein